MNLHPQIGRRQVLTITKDKFQRISMKNENMLQAIHECRFVLQDAFIGFGGNVSRPKVEQNADWFVRDFQVITVFLSDYHI